MNTALILAGAGGLVLVLVAASARKTGSKSGPRNDLNVHGFPIDLPAFKKLVDARNSPEKNADYLMKTLNAPTI